MDSGAVFDSQYSETKMKRALEVGKGKKMERKKKKRKEKERQEKGKEKIQVRKYFMNEIERLNSA